MSPPKLLRLAGTRAGSGPGLARRLAYLMQPSVDLLLSPGGPLEWSQPLFQLQLDGINTLLGHEALLLADDMGLGKTIEVIGAMRILVLRRRLTRAKEDVSHKALVLSVRAGGQGLNLQDASYVFHFDRWWNPAVEHQAEDRSHRFGQTMPVHVYKYICADTIEEKIDRVLWEKLRLFTDIVDDVSIDLESSLTAEDFFNLFVLTPPVGAGTEGEAARHKQP